MVESDIYQLYLAKEDFSYDADREIVRKLYKTFIDGNEDFDTLRRPWLILERRQIPDRFVRIEDDQEIQPRGWRWTTSPATILDGGRSRICLRPVPRNH